MRDGSAWHITGNAPRRGFHMRHARLTVHAGLALLLGFGCGGHNNDVTPDACTDADGDGQTNCAGDCDDADPLTYTGAPEVCGDGKDNSCGGSADASCNGLGTFVSEITGD